MKIAIALSCLLAAVCAEHAPVYHAAPVHHAPAPHHGGGYHEPIYENTPPKYEFEYGVHDDHYNNYGHKEYRDGYSTGGEYHVQLPDGRTQHVTYKVADAYSGYVADVKYDGEAKHPEPVYHKPVYHEPAHPHI